MGFVVFRAITDEFGSSEFFHGADQVLDACGFFGLAGMGGDGDEAED